MNSKIKKVGLVVSILIVIIILVDLLFNLSGVLSERFQNSNETSEMERRFNNAVSNSQNNATDNQEKEAVVKSIESIYSTARYNVVALPFNASTTPTTIVNIKSDNFNSLSVSNDIISRTTSDYSDNAQTFKLVKMENMRDVANYIGQGTYIPATEEEFPYYFVKAPGASNMVLHMGDTDLSLVKASNRTNQRFKVHSEEYQGITNRNRDTLDIKIKLDQESINTIISKMGISDLNNTAGEFDSNESLEENERNCNLDQWIPRDAVESMCGYCNPDLID